MQEAPAIKFLTVLRRGHLRRNATRSPAETGGLPDPPAGPDPLPAPAETPAQRPNLDALPVPGLFARNARLRERSTAFEARLEAGSGAQRAALDAALARLDRAARLRPDQNAYAAEHRLRFAEALHAISDLLAEVPDWPRCQVLEVGSSITPMLFHDVFPDLRLTSLCLFKHPQLDGVVEHAVQMDLEKLDLRGEAGLGPPRPGLQGLHLVMLCEVLEHLAVNPVNLFRALAATLRPGGFLYVTTPNFLRAGARDLVLSGRNPQPIFPAHFTAAERFHHHFREYTMAELLEAMVAAGLEPEVAQYSACWDSPEAAARLPANARRNLVVIGRRPQH